MSETVFFRLLAQEDKGTALGGAVEALRARANGGEVYEADPRTFSLVPTSPFAYWASDAVRHLFATLPPLEGDGRTVKQGLATADDFRFVRAWWEIAPGRILDGANGPREDLSAFQAWCRQRTHKGKRWAPFAKGGEYSPFYADLHLVVNWERDGEEIRAFPQAFIRNETSYFRHGLTWPLRGIRLSTQAVPAGTIFSVAGKMAFSDRQDEILPLLGITNARPFDYFVGAFAGKVGGVQYEVGLISRVPVPSVLEGQGLDCHAERALAARLVVEQSVETSHAFVRPALLTVEGDTLAARLGRWSERATSAEQDLAAVQAAIDDIALDLYGISDEDRDAIRRWFDEMGRGTTMPDGEEGAAEESETVEPSHVELTSSPVLAHGLASYAIGCAFGRWDVRIGNDPSLAPTLPGPFDPLPLCPPGALVGPDALPAIPGRIASEEWLRARPNVITLPPEGAVNRPTVADAEYPLEVAWDGILVDDEGNGRDVVARVRALLELLWGEQVEGIEREACDLLGVKSLRDYFRNPRGFWEDHVKRYSKSKRKAPIYWLLQSSKRSYGLWLYYHRLDGDLLFKALTNYVEPKIQLEEGRLRDLRAQRAQVGATGSAARQAERAIERQEALIAELEDFRDKLRRAASLGLKPDLDDGVVLNAAPLWQLMPWKVAKDYWEELRQGKYEWSSIGKQLRARQLVA